MQSSKSSTRFNKLDAWSSSTIFSFPLKSVVLYATGQTSYDWLSTCSNFMVSSKTQRTGGGGRGPGELLPIHSLKRNPSERNPNEVLTTCKAISKGLASGFVYWSYALRQKPWINGFERKSFSNNDRFEVLWARETNTSPKPLFSLWLNDRLSNFPAGFRTFLYQFTSRL